MLEKQGLSARKNTEIVTPQPRGEHNLTTFEGLI